MACNLSVAKHNLKPTCHLYRTSLLHIADSSSCWCSAVLSKPASFQRGCFTHAGASSGLHHDFHDNLYILLRGRKTFRLYPPSCAPNMYTYGKLHKVYPNGRIVYQGQGNILPDGSGTNNILYCLFAITRSCICMSYQQVVAMRLCTSNDI